MSSLRHSFLSMAAMAIGAFGILQPAAAADPFDIERLLHGPISGGSTSARSHRRAVTGDRTAQAKLLLHGSVTRNDGSRASGVIVVDDLPPIILKEGPGKNDRVDVSIKGFKTDGDAEKVRRALWIAMKRFHRPHILEDAAKYTRRHKEITKDTNGDEWEVEFDSTKEAREAVSVGAWGLMNYYGLNPKARRFDIEIVGEDMDGASGNAPVGIVKSGGLPKYRLKLNRGIIADRSADQIAGTIFHEMLHNIGWRHGASGKGYNVDYAGYLIKEWGLAIARNGKSSFGLTADRYVRWDE